MVKWLKRRVLVALARTIYDYQINLYILYRRAAYDSLKHGNEADSIRCCEYAAEAAKNANHLADWFGTEGRMTPTLVDKALARLTPLFFTWA